MGSLTSIIKRIANKQANDLIDGDDDLGDKLDRRDARQKWHDEQKERYWKWKERKRKFRD